MEVIAGTASLSQLAAYSFSSIRYLRQVYSGLKSGHSTYCDEERNITFLLNIVQRLSDHDVTDTDPVLPLLIDISGLACQILNHLRPTVFLGFSWTPFVSRDKLKTAFESLSKKRELLELHISQANNEAITTLKRTVSDFSLVSRRDPTPASIATRSTTMSEGNSAPAGNNAPQGSQRTSFKLERNNINGVGWWHSGHGKTCDDVNMSDNNVVGLSIAENHDDELVASTIKRHLEHKSSSDGPASTLGKEAATASNTSASSTSGSYATAAENVHGVRDQEHRAEDRGRPYGIHMYFGDGRSVEAGKDGRKRNVRRRPGA